MLGFLWMDEEGLGFDPSIMESEGKRFIEIERDGKPERFIIDEIITRPRCIASRATTCWKAHREDDPLKTPLVIKDSWQYPERGEEGLLVKEATEMGVVNVARYYHHEAVHIGGVEDEIRTLIRKGLDTVAATADTADATTGTQAAADTTATTAESDTVDTIAATATSTMSAITAMARRRSTSSSASLTPTVAAAATSSSRRRGRSVASRGKKTTRVMQLRESSSRSGNSSRDGNSGDNSDNSGSSSGVAGTKRRQSDANLDDDDDDDDVAAATERPAKRSRSESVKSGDAKTLTNRVHRRVVLQDYGRPIYTASSPTALLAALESCIRGHESLRRQAGFLHRDISINNVVIDEDGPADRKGFLIDLDLVIKEQRIKGSGTKKKTGTRAFMAIGVLMGKQHSFMHDLESFFWVLFWICVHYDGPDKARKSESDEWNFMRDRNLAGAKIIMIYDSESCCGEAKSSLTPFYAPLIPLMDKLRAVVFPNGQPWKQLDEGLYSVMRKILLQDLE